MVSITDSVSEGLKYPLNDLKKVFIFGILFTLLGFISFGIIEEIIKLFIVFSKSSGMTLASKFSNLPANDIYIIAILAIITLIISIFIMGYQYKVMKFSIERKNDLPEYGDVLNLLTNGLKYLIVCLIYNILPIAVFLLGMESILNDYLVSAIALILYIICNFLLIMALPNMVDTGKIAKAFDFREIIDKIANLGWVKYVGIILFTLIIYAIIMAAVGIIFSVISTILALIIPHPMIITAITLIIGGLVVSPYISIFFARVYGSIYREANK